MLFRADEAKKMPCPLSFGGPERVSCHADGCPLWRWTESLQLSTTTYLDDTVRKEIEAVYKPGVEAPKSEQFETPSGEGWTPHGAAEWNPNSAYPKPGAWVQRWERKLAPERIGFCGLGGKIEL